MHRSYPGAAPTGYAGAMDAPNGALGPKVGTARMADGTNLHTLRWEAGGEPWAVAQIVHGLGEHGGRYGTVAAALTDAGVETWAYDQRGNGRSDGPRAYVERWSILHDDLQARLTGLREAHPNTPLVVYGHSLGGLVAAGYMLSGRDRPLPDLLVLSAPALDAEVPVWKKRLARVLTGVVPKVKMANDLPGGARARDGTIDAEVDEDPFCADKTTVRFGAEAFKEQDRVRRILPGLAAMPVPTYVLHGSADPIVPLRATDVFDDMGNATRRIHGGLRHECHHEPEHADVLAEVVDWLRAAARAGGPEGEPAPVPGPEPIATGV